MEFDLLFSFPCVATSCLEHRRHEPCKVHVAPGGEGVKVVVLSLLFLGREDKRPHPCKSVSLLIITG